MRLIADNISIIRSQSNALYNSTLLFSCVIFYSNKLENCNKFLKLKNIYSVLDWGFSVLMFMPDTCSYSLNQLSWDVGTGAVLSFHAGVTHGILPYKRSCRLESSCVQSNSCHSRHVTEETDESIFKFQTHTAHIIWLDPFITQNLIWADMP